MRNDIECVEILIGAERGTIKAAAKFIGVHRSTLDR
jgi:hypothetical protein